MNNGRSFYYYQGFSSILHPPFFLDLLVNVSVNSVGDPVVYFWYNVGHGFVEYDEVVVNANNSSNVYFLVNGYQYTPSGNFYDAELVMVGDGSSAYIYNSDVYMLLLYWNGNNFQEVRNAYNFGSDTAETTEGILAGLYYVPQDGIMAVGLTTGLEIVSENILGELWNENYALLPNIKVNIEDGYAIVFNSSYSYNEANAFPLSRVNFVNGQLHLTLYPLMNYYVFIYNYNGTFEGEAYINSSYGFTSVIAYPFVIYSNSYNFVPSKSYSVPITIEGNGYINISLSGLPYGAKYTLTNINFIYGQKTIYLNLYDIPMGNYNIKITGEIDGMLSYGEINLRIGYAMFPVNFTYDIIGTSPNHTPKVLLIFPNGSMENVNFGLYNLPNGTRYIVENISLGDIRWASPLISGIVNSSLNLRVNYYEQYLVTFSTIGKNTLLPLITLYYFNYKEKVYPGTFWVNAYSKYIYENILSGNNERWIAFNYEGEIVSPGNVSVIYYHEYYVNVNSPNIYAIINGSKEILTSGWYLYGTSINIINVTYLSNDVRCIVSNVHPSLSFIVKSPLNINISLIKQYFINVTSPIPIYAVVNGYNSTFTSGWYDSGIHIYIENITYYPEDGERILITNMNYKDFTLNSPINIKISTLTQYFVKVKSLIPLYAIINGKNVSFTSGWYDSGIHIYIENITYYVSSWERIIENIITEESFTLNSPQIIEVHFIKQYFINVVSPLPVKALVNGTLEFLKSGWYDENTIIKIENYTYYVNRDERFIFGNITSPTIIVNSTYTIKMSTIEQFLVAINGIKEWYNNGSTIKLSNVPFYEVGKFIGTYYIYPGGVLKVVGPIHEFLVSYVNPIFLALLGIPLIPILFYLSRKNKR